MKIENLQKGQIIKNYKELCFILDINPTTGYSKIKQLNELQMYCNYSKDKNKFIINEIYETPIILLDRNNNKYIDLIANILVAYLHSINITNKKSVILTAGNMMEILGLVNENYNIGNRHKKELSQVLNINLLSVYYFYNNTRNEFKNIISRSLKSLKNRRVLDYITTKMIYTNDKRYIEATEEERSLIVDIEKTALNRLNLESFKDVFLQCKVREFQKIVKELTPSNWKYYFDAYKLFVGEVALKIEYDNLEIKKLELNKRALERTDKRLKLNDTMIDLITLKDNLINLIKYDLDLGDNIMIKYKDNLKELQQKVIKKESQILDIEKEIKELREENYKDINIEEYREYINKIRLESFTEEIDQLFEEFNNLQYID